MLLLTVGEGDGDHLQAEAEGALVAFEQLDITLQQQEKHTIAQTLS